MGPVYTVIIIGDGGKCLSAGQSFVQVFWEPTQVKMRNPFTQTLASDHVIHTGSI